MTENEMRGVNTILEGALCAAELSTRSPGFHRLAFPHIYICGGKQEIEAAICLVQNAVRSLLISGSAARPPILREGAEKKAEND
jgi:hypothetical protein